MRFDRKTAVVTGGGSGIGAAIAERLATEGARVLIWEVNPANAATVVQTIQRAGGAAEAIACDVADLDSVRTAARLSGEIDILINNAGIAHIGTAESTTPADFDRVHSVNVKGVYHCMHAILPSMRKRGAGVILNMASIASRLGIQDRFAYSMSKGAVLAMTLSVAKDYVGAGIRCNCLCPARIHTPFVDAYLEQHYADRKDEMFARLSAYQPIGRMGEPAEVAALAAFICSDEAAFITGSAIDIDGGVMNLR
jgi:NAD(P)-dependent dehydrogenase (short-subunit alcohol dehydrogenase family)